MKAIILTVASLALCLGFASSARQAEAQDKPPYTIIKKDASGTTVDWATFNGYRRYHSSCHVCHGPDAMGSSFAPALVDSLKTITYDQYLNIVTNGRKNVNTASQKEMPAFANDPNVMCFIDDIYAYLKARADGALGRERPEHAPKPADAQAAEDSCLGVTPGSNSSG
jgi:methanol metabolism-related c-type cytochrome